MHVKDVAAFVLFLGNIHPTLVRKFLAAPDKVTRAHTLVVTHSNKCYVDALETIDRSRAEPPGDAYDALNSSYYADDAIVYAAFHQHFATNKYPQLLHLKRGFDDKIVQDAKEKLVEVHTAITASNTEIRILKAAAAAPEVDFDFSVPKSQYPELRAAAKVNAEKAMTVAKRARTHAIHAVEDYKTDIRLTEN